MKILLIMFTSLIMNFEAFAQNKAEGCIDSALRAKFALKMKGVLGGLREESLDGNKKTLFHNDVDPQKICGMVSQEQKDEFDEQRESSRQVKKHLVKQFANKKKIPADVFVALNADTTKTELTEAEVCEETSKVVKNSVSSSACDSDKFALAGAGKVDSLNGSFDEVCQKLLPIYREAYKRVQRCGVNQASEKKPNKALAKDKSPDAFEMIDAKSTGPKKYAKPAKSQSSGSSSKGSGKTGSQASGQ